MFLSDPFRDFDALFSRVTNPTAVLPMDAWRDSTALHLSFEVPGAHEDAIDISVDRGVLTLTVDTAIEEVEGERLMSGRTYGRRTRRLTLGDGFDSDAIEARLEAGILSLTIPLAERAKPRRIEIGTSRQKELTEK